MCYRSQIVRFRENLRQAIVNGSLPPHRKECSTQVHLKQHQRYEQHETGGSLCNSSSHVGREYNVRANWCVTAGEKRKTDLTHTGLLMEGIGSMIEAHSQAVRVHANYFRLSCYGAVSVNLYAHADQ